MNGISISLVRIHIRKQGDSCLSLDVFNSNLDFIPLFERFICTLHDCFYGYCGCLCVTRLDGVTLCVLCTEVIGTFIFIAFGVYVVVCISCYNSQYLLIDVVDG